MDTGGWFGDTILRSHNVLWHIHVLLRHTPVTMFRLVLRISNDKNHRETLAWEYSKILWCGFESSVDLFTAVYDKLNIVIPYDFVLVVANKGLPCAQTMCVSASSVRLILVLDLASLKSTKCLAECIRNSLLWYITWCSWVSDGCGKATKSPSFAGRQYFCIFCLKDGRKPLSLFIPLQWGQRIMHTA